MTSASKIADPTRFQAALDKIDAINENDPRRDTLDDAEYGYERVYAEHLTRWLFRLEREPSEPLQLAIRGLHIERWTVPRAEYPMTRDGYHEWKNRLREYHAERARQILGEIGYDRETIDRVAALIDRSTFPDDLEAQIVEDAVSLLLLEFQFAEFAEKTERSKLMRVIRRVWRNMTAKAQEIALSMPLDETHLAIVGEALAPVLGRKEDVPDE